MKRNDLEDLETAEEMRALLQREAEQVVGGAGRANNVD